MQYRNSKTFDQAAFENKAMTAVVYWQTHQKLFAKRMLIVECL